MIMKNLKKIIAGLGVALLMLSFSVQGYAQWGVGVKGNGKVVTTERKVPDFSAIEVSCSADVIISQGKSGTVKVRTDENLQDKIDIDVKGDVLEIETDGNIRNYKELEVYVAVETLNAITINGSGNVESEGTIEGMDFEIRVNGSGDVDLDLDVKNLKTKINGSGDVQLTGVQGNFDLGINGSGDVEAENLRLSHCNIKLMGSGDVSLEGSAVEVTVEQSASGDINLYRLNAEDVNISASGSGDVVVSVSGDLKVKLRGSGDVTYKGEPTSVDVSTLGSGEVYHR